ncbi:MAG: hypothetical protein U1E95_00030 [Rubrivivax sp.]
MQLRAHAVEGREPQVQRRVGAARQQRRQRDVEVGQQVAQRTRVQLAAARGQRLAQVGPGRAQALADAVLADLVQQRGLGLLVDEARQRGVEAAVQAVGLRGGGEGAVGRRPQPEGFEALPRPARDRLAPQHDARGAVFVGQRRRRRRQGARQLAPGHRHRQPVAPRARVQFGQEEVGPAAGAQAGTVEQPGAAQPRVDRGDVEGVGRRPGVGQRQRLPGVALHLLPQGFAFGEPGADLMARERGAERQPALPAEELAHLQQVGAQRQLGRVTRVGDVAIGLHRRDQRLQPLGGGAGALGQCHRVARLAGRQVRDTTSTAAAAPARPSG